MGADRGGDDVRDDADAILYCAFLLGVFEAGFFPCIIPYFTYWYPSVRRGQVIAIFMSATTIISVIAGPLCGAILKYFDGMNGWAGWQWLFLVQGLPAAILGVIIYFYLQDKPADANWLSPAEKNLLRHNLEHDDKDIEGETESTVGQMIRDPKVYLLALVYFLLLGATYTMVFWLPTLIQSWGRQGPAADRHLLRDSERGWRRRNDPDRTQFRQAS
jgi:MFS family permease